MTKHGTQFSDLQHLCLLRLSAIGDILNLLPSVDFVLSNYPHLKITWIIGKGEATLFKYFAQRFAGRLELVVFDKQMSYGQAWRYLRSINNGQPFDMLIHAQTSLRSNLLAWMIKADIKVGFSKERSFEWHGWVVDYQVPTQQSMHVLLDHWDQFRAFVTPELDREFVAKYQDTRCLYSGDQNELDTAPGLPSYKYRQQHNLEAVIDLGIDTTLLSPELEQVYQQIARLQQQGSDVVLFNVASSALKKNWTISGYQQLLDHLLARGFVVVLTGSKNPVELSLVQQVLAGVTSDASNSNVTAPTASSKTTSTTIPTSQNTTSHNSGNNLEVNDSNSCSQLLPVSNGYLVNLAGQTNLAQLVVFAQQCNLAVSPDSGPMHLASLLGKPTLGLFAYINPMRSGPYQSADFVVSVFHNKLYGKDNDFSKAQLALDLKNWRRKPSKDLDLMQAITAQQVIVAFERLYASYKG